MPEKPRLTTEDIGDFYVTKRHILRIFHMLGVEKRDILSLPENAVVAEVGSGIHQDMEQGLRDLRPDLNVVSIDPTLGLGKERMDVSVSGDSEKEDHVHYYIKMRELPTKEVSHYKMVQEERFENKQSGAVAALAPDLPFRNESVDLLIDSDGGFEYVRERDIKDYVRAIVRILKPGGEARIRPIERLFLRDNRDYLGKRKEVIVDFLRDFPELEPIFEEQNATGSFIWVRKKVESK